MSRILIAEDDIPVSSFIERGLHANGYVSHSVHDGAAALEVGRFGAFDLMVLDIGLPNRSGLEVLEQLRGSGSKMPVIVLTGSRERDPVVCLEGGADDYMKKPFHFEELLARIRARLRQSGTAHVMELAVGEVRLDLRTRRATVDGHTVELSGREFALLETFMRHPGQVLTRTQLLSHVWGFDADPTTNAVNMCVSNLRSKLRHDAIETVRGAGYRFRR